jgi:hypothetical protein
MVTVTLPNVVPPAGGSADGTGSPTAQSVVTKGMVGSVTPLGAAASGEDGAAADGAAVTAAEASAEAAAPWSLELEQPASPAASTAVPRAMAIRREVIGQP